MTLADLRAAMRRRIGNPSTSEVPDATLDVHINNAYSFLVDRFDQPESKFSQAVYTQPGQQTYTISLAGSIIGVTSGVDGRRLRKITDDVRYSMDPHASGMPVAYSRFGGGITLFPTPVSEEKLVLYTKGVAVALTTPTSVPNLASSWHEGIVLRATYNYYDELGDLAKAQARLSSFNEWVSTKSLTSDAEGADQEYIVQLPTVAADAQQDRGMGRTFRNNRWYIFAEPE